MSALPRHEALVLTDQYLVQFYGPCLSNPEVPDAPQGPHVCIVQIMIGLQSGEPWFSSAASRGQLSRDVDLGHRTTLAKLQPLIVPPHSVLKPYCCTIKPCFLLNTTASPHAQVVFRKASEGFQQSLATIPETAFDLGILWVETQCFWPTQSPSRAGRGLDALPAIVVYFACASGALVRKSRGGSRP